MLEMNSFSSIYSETINRIIYGLLAIIIFALALLFLARKYVICVEGEILATVFLMKYCVLQIIKYLRITYCYISL